MKNAGVKVVGIAPFLIWGADFSLVPANSPIRTLGDLKGKKIGVSSRNNLDCVVMRAVARKAYKFDLEKEASFTEGAPSLLCAA